MDRTTDMKASAEPGDLPSLRDIQRFVREWSEEALVVHEARPDVYWVEGGGGNSGVIVGDDGVVVIDAKVSASAGSRLLAEIAGITSKPITQVILTHGDGDHVMGLAQFPPGITIIAHENCKRDIEAANAIGLMGTVPASALPNHTFRTELSETLAGVRFRLLHIGPAHTGGDIVVHLPDHRLVFSGDLLSWGGSATPIIHRERHGSASGWLAAVRAMVALEADTFVTGHGDTQTTAEVEAKLAQFELQYARIEAMVAAGTSLTDVERAMAVHDPAPLARGLRLPSFASVAYQQLTETTEANG